MTARDSLTVLREPNFRWYALARLVNLTGSTMASVALAFAVLEVSDSPSALGTVLASFSIPLVVFMLVGGVVADRFDRALVIRVCNVVAGLSQLAVATLVLSGVAQLWHLVVLTAFSGTAAAVSFPALAGVLPQLVPRDRLQPANVLMSMMRSGLTVIGPSTAGVLVVTIGPGWAVAIDGLTYLASAAIMLLVRLPARERTEGSSPIAELRDGWTLFRGTPWLWTVVLAFSLICALHQGGFITLGPVLATRTDIGETGWGLILSAEALGLLLTGFVMLRVRLERPLFWGMLGAALWGLPLVALGTRPELPTVLVAAFVAGLGIEVFALAWNLAMQENIPEDMLSRASSYDALGSLMAVPLGQLVAGPLALAFGLQPVILVAGLGLAAVSLATLLSPAVRNLPRAAEPVAVDA